MAEQETEIIIKSALEEQEHEKRARKQADPKKGGSNCITAIRYLFRGQIQLHDSSQGIGLCNYQVLLRAHQMGYRLCGTWPPRTHL